MKSTFKDADARLKSTVVILKGSVNAGKPVEEIRYVCERERRCYGAVRKGSGAADDIACVLDPADAAKMAKSARKTLQVQNDFDFNRKT